MKYKKVSTLDEIIHHSLDVRVSIAKSVYDGHMSIIAYHKGSVVAHIQCITLTKGIKEVIEKFNKYVDSIT